MTSEMVCVPAMNREDGPTEYTVCAPAKYRPGMDVSPARLTTGWLLVGLVDAPRVSGRKGSDARWRPNPVPAMTWSTSIDDRCGPSSSSRTPSFSGDAFLMRWL